LKPTLDVLRQAVAEASSYMANAKTQEAIADLQIYQIYKLAEPGFLSAVAAP
jgi:hypothetical protein